MATNFLKHSQTEVEDTQGRKTERRSKMPDLLLVDPQPVCREPLAKLLQLTGYRVTCVAQALEAVRALQAAKPQLIILELALPGLSGLAFLRALRQSAAVRDIPVIILSSMAAPEIIRAAALLGVKDFLLKSNFAIDDLLGRIKRLTGTRASPHAPPVRQPTQGASSGAPASPTQPQPQQPAPSHSERRAIPKLLTREQVLERIERCGESKTLSGVVSQIISLASSPRGEVSDLVCLLKQDVVLATRVLQAANSAAYISEKPRINTVEEAVRNVGLSTVRNIALSVGVYEAFPSDARDGFNLVRCWQHSVAVAAN
jgi:CheY-like chemotaxis protein